MKCWVKSFVGEKSTPQKVRTPRFLFRFCHSITRSDQLGLLASVSSPVTSGERAISSLTYPFRSALVAAPHKCPMFPGSGRITRQDSGQLWFKPQLHGLRGYAHGLQGAPLTATHKRADTEEINFMSPFTWSSRKGKNTSKEKTMKIEVASCRTGDDWKCHKAAFQREKFYIVMGCETCDILIAEIVQLRLVHFSVCKFYLKIT